jgi:PKD repeat protein
LKRLIYLVTFILLAISISATSVDLDLATDSFGSGQQLQGILTLETDSTVSLEDKVTFDVAGKKISEKIKDLILSGTITSISEAIEKKGTPKQTADYSFSGEATKVEYAFDLSLGDTIDFETVEKINSLSFDIDGEEVSSQFPTGVRIDIDNDGEFEYTYQGELLSGEFEDLDSSYLSSDTPDSYPELKGSNTVFICQPVTLLPSKNFTITVKGKKTQETDETRYLRILLSETPEMGAKENCDDDPDSCCDIFGDQIDVVKDYSCSVQLEINEEKTAYACAFVPAGGADQTYYSIGADFDDENSVSYYNGELKTDLDFFITVQRQKFDSRLVDKTSVSIEGKDISLNELVPVAIYSSSPGKITLSNPKLSYSQQGIDYTLDKITKVDYNPESLEFSTPVNLSLGTFADLVAPNAEGKDYEVYAEFLGKEGSIKKFDVVAGLSAGIQTSTLTPYIGEDVVFSSTLNASNTTYKWAFGDSINASGKTTTHSYSEEGEYLVTLIMDQNGIISTNTATLNVASLRDSIAFMVSDAKEKAEATKAKITNAKAEIKPALTLLNLDSKISGTLNNLSTIEKEVNATLSNIEINQAQQDQSLAIAHAKLKSIVSQLVVSFEVTGSNFDSKVYSLDDIPTAIQLQLDPVDSFQERLFMAQQSVQVKGYSYVLTLDYLSGDRENLVLVKKEVIGGGEYYEVLPATATVKEIIQPAGTTYAQTNIIKFTSSPLVYTLNSLTSEQALISKTIVVPANLASISIGTIEEISSSCGDGVCDLLTEGESTCPTDCSPSKPWWVLIPLIIILGGGIFYIFFYKGKGSFHSLFGRKKVRPPATLFKSDKDRHVIKSYIRGSLRKGFADMQIKFALKTKGWKEEQIVAAIKEVKTEKAKPH